MDFTSLKDSMNCISPLRVCEIVLDIEGIYSIEKAKELIEQINKKIEDAEAIQKIQELEKKIAEAKQNITEWQAAIKVLRS